MDNRQSGHREEVVISERALTHHHLASNEIDHFLGRVAELGTNSLHIAALCSQTGRCRISEDTVDELERTSRGIVSIVTAAVHADGAAPHHHMFQDIILGGRGKNDATPLPRHDVKARLADNMVQTVSTEGDRSLGSTVG